MSAERGCEEVRPMLSELALGIAEGRERADALEHLAGCAECRSELDQLADVADELLLVAPERAPSPGFEGRALDAIPAPRRRQRRRRHVLIPALAAGIAAAVTAAVLVAVFSDDRDLAASYRDTLAEADGKYFAATGLYAAGGRSVGNVFGYEGSPSWIYVSAEAADPHSERYAVEAVTARGRRVRLGPMALQRGEGGAGWQLPISFGDVAEVRLLGDRPADSLRAEFGESESE